MADGNMGNLFVSLGIKDEMSNALQKIIKEMKGVDQATQEAKKRGEELVSSLNSINGNNFSKVFRDVNEYIEKNSKGVSGIVKMLNTLKAEDLNALTSKFLGARNFTNIASILRTVNAELEKMSGNEDKAGNVKIWKSKISNALDYIKLLQDINEQQKKISNTKSENPNVDTKSLDNARKSLAGIRSEIAGLLSSGGVDDANVLKGFQKLLSVAKKDVKDIVSTFKKDNVLSNFSGGAAKVEADIARVTEKLAKMRDLMSEGTQKGYSTSMLTGSISELDNILSRLNAAKLNPTMLTDAAQMRNLISDVLVEMVKATAATQAYGREKGKIIAQEKAAAEEYDRQRRQRDAAKKAQDEELKALSDYAKRYMELQEAKIKADKKASDERKRQSEAERKRIETDTARMSKLYATMSLAIGRGERAGMRGLELGVNTSALEKAISDATELKKRIEDANIALMGKGGIPSYSSYAEEVNRLSSSLINATNAQKDLNSAQDKANRKAEAQATRDAAKAKREDAAAERQRQREIEISTRRMERLDDVLVRLRKEYGNSVKLQVDTTQIETKIKDIENQFNYLKSILQRLGSRDSTALGLITNVGDQREVQLANRVADAQREANREAQRGIELEHKRQQEISQSAAKARNDLAAAFAGANAEAKKMQSIVGDIKSLFLQGGIVFGAQQFFNSIVKTGGEIVQQHVALRSILGDVQKADELFAQTQQLALQSPFKFGELNRDVKQLAAFGVEANDLYDTTKRLADIASGLGVDFGRLGLAFGQVKARSWLDGKELRQFAYAGLPLLQKITELYNAEGKNGRNNYTQADVKKMISARQVSFEDVQKVLWKMTDEGGQFYNMQFVLSETLLGRWNKLIDAWDIMLGKFAEGKNVVGGTFSFLINRTTDLILALDKVSNAALAFGAMYALRKGATAIASRVGISSNLAALRAEQQVKLRTFAVEQQQALIEGKITLEKMRQNIADYQGMLNSKITTRNAVEQAALDGRLSALKMQKAFREGLISKEMIEQLRLMGMISAKESELITKEGTRARMSLAVNHAKGKLGGFFSGWNIATLGITIGTALYSAYSQFKDSIKQDTDRINETAKTTVKTLSDTLSEVGNKGTGATLQQQVDKMTDVLKQSGLYTDSIKEQIDSTDDLGKEYDILKQKIIDARNENNFTPREGENFAKAKKASGAGFAGGASWFGQWTGIGQDDIDENINDVAANLAQLQMKMEKFGDSTKSSMEKVANSILGARAAGMTFEEKIAEICSSRGVNGYWETFVKKVSNGNKDVEDDLRVLEGDLDDFSGNFGQIATDDIPKYLEYMAKSRNMDMVEFSMWCKQHPDKFRTMLDQMLSEANKKVPGLVERLQSVAMAILNIGKAKPQEGNTGPKVWKNPNKVGTIERKAFDKLQKAGMLKGGKDGFWQKEMAEYLHNLNGGNSNGWTSFGEAVRKRYKEVRDENDNAKNAGDRQPYVSEQRMLEAIAAQSGISLDVGKNKVTGHFGKGKNKNGREEDKQLKDLRERIDLYKKMYAEIKKFKELYGEGSLGQLANDGEFGAIFNDKKRFPISDYTNYETSIKELLKTLPASTRERLDYVANEKAGIQTEKRKLLEDQRRDELNVLNKQLDTISEQYETYKKIYELTGNKKGSENIAFGGTVQFDTYKKFLEEQLDVAVKHDNIQSGLNLTMDEVKGMSLENVKDKYGEESRVYDIRKKLEDENNKIKKETIDLMANLIEKNATIAQQIEDENRKYERHLELINGIEDTQMRDRAKAGATKTHNENVAKLQFEQFKQESDWVAIFDDLDRVSSATIDSMIEKIDQLSMTTGLSVESIKQLRDALDKLRNEQISRNPFGFIFGGVNRGKAIGKFINDHLGGMDDTAKIFVSKEDASRLGIAGGVRTKASLKNDQQSAYADSSNAFSELVTKMHALNTVLDPVINLFKAIGEEDSILGQIAGGASDAISSAASTAGAFDTLGKMRGLGFLKGADPYAATASAALSIGGSLIKAFGADYSSYNKAKAEYDNLTSIWDSLISKKTEYMNIHWGTEATEASKEAQEMLKAEIEQTKVIAQKRLNAGASAGSHSIKYRMWKGSYKYNGQNWRDVAGEISSKYGVRFNGMEDMLNMNADTLSKIKKDYTGLWANMDSDFRDYLEKLIQYGEKADDIIEALTEKLTGNKFSDLVSSWGDAMSTMANSSDNLVDHFEENLKKVILNSMIENLYGDRIKAVLKKAEDYAKNGEVAPGGTPDKPSSQYTDREMSDIMSDVDSLAKDIEAQRDWFKSYYNWSDNSSSSSRNSAKNITEETADILVSYCNSIRADLAMVRESQAKFIPEMSEIAKSQLTQLNAIARNTLRNADAAERIESIFVEYNDNFNRVLNGTKSLKMK